MKTNILKVGAVVVLFLISAERVFSQGNKNMTSLFDGKTLNGWEGDRDIWQVKDGAIVGGSKTKTLLHNYFLTTKSSYGNFMLKLKFKVIAIDGFINGGVQFHSQRIANPPHEMSGYQADIGPGYWGSLYDESRRNIILMAPDSILLSTTLKLKGWNDYEIHARNGKIAIYLNGKKMVDYEEKDKNIPQEGLIGLQVHGGGKVQIMYKDIKIHQLTNLDKDGYVQIFDGKTLDGWEGDPTYWRVEEGKLVGEVTPATILSRNSFIIWRGKIVKDFELKVEYRVSAEGNSGINYRSEKVEGVPYALRGYQADLDGAQNYTGSNYEERRRTTLASRGEQVALPAVDNADSVKMHIRNNRWSSIEVTGSLGSADSLRSFIKNEDWNEYHLVIKGNRLKHYINGVLMSDITDNDTVNRKFSGLLGVQVHVGPPMKIEYRNFRLKQL